MYIISIYNNFKWDSYYDEICCWYAAYVQWNHCTKIAFFLQHLNSFHQFSIVQNITERLMRWNVSMPCKFFFYFKCAHVTIKLISICIGIFRFHLIVVQWLCAAARDIRIVLCACICNSPNGYPTEPRRRKFQFTMTCSCARNYRRRSLNG